MYTTHCTVYTMYNIHCIICILHIVQVVSECMLIVSVYNVNLNTQKRLDLISLYTFNIIYS